MKTRTFASLLIFFGVILVAFNIIGYFHYTEVSRDNRHLLDTNPENISETAFWNNAYQKNDETLEEYLPRITSLISNRMLRIDPTQTKPTVFENWILWAYSNYKGSYEWSETGRAVRLGGGFCSQHAIVLNNLLRQQGIDSRILKLQGHVVNEVLVGDNWNVYDSDYNINFHATLQHLENNPSQVYQAYIEAGASEGTAKNFEAAFATAADNFRYKKTRSYREEKHYIESASLYLVWVIPVLLILLGIKLRTSAS